MEDNKIKLGVDPTPVLEGIGGWLLVALIGLVWSPVSHLISIINIFEMMEFKSIIADLNVPMAYFTIASVGHVVMIICSTIMLFLFFKKMKLYVLSVYIEMGLSTFFFLLLMIVIKSVPELFNQLIPAAFTGIVAIIVKFMYYRTSVRVKNTFVN